MTHELAQVYSSNIIKGTIILFQSLMQLHSLKHIHTTNIKQELRVFPLIKQLYRNVLLCFFIFIIFEQVNKSRLSINFRINTTELILMVIFL